MKRRGILGVLAALFVAPVAMSMPTPRRIPLPPSRSGQVYRSAMRVPGEDVRPRAGDHVWFREPQHGFYRVTDDRPDAVSTFLFYEEEGRHFACAARYRVPMSGGDMVCFEILPHSWG